MQTAVASTVPAGTAHHPSRLMTVESRPAYPAALWRADGKRVVVLVVDSSRARAEMFATTMRHEGAVVRRGGDEAAALAAASIARPDIAIVDARLPDMDGARCIHRLRARQPDLPVVLFGAAPSEHDRQTRLRACADWLSEPFSLEEILLRVRMVLCRNGVALQEDYVEMALGDLVLKEDSRQVSRAGTLIPLTYREFELLRFFMRNADRVVTRRQILSRAWPYDFPGGTSVVGMYVSYLRRKIDAGRAPLIHTLPRTGYILKSLAA